MLAPIAQKSGDIFYIQSFGDEALFFFVLAFLPADISKFVKIKNTTLHICTFQKKVVILHALQMTKVLHMSKKCSNFAETSTLWESKAVILQPKR